MLYLNLSDIAVITVKGFHYRCIIHDIRIYEVIYLLEHSVLDDCGYIKDAYQYQELILQLF